MVDGMTLLDLISIEKAWDMTRNLDLVEDCKLEALVPKFIPILPWSVSSGCAWRYRRVTYLMWLGLAAET